MSICEDVERILSDKNALGNQASSYKRFEAATNNFEELVNCGVVQKRGYQLMPIASTLTNNIVFNNRKI